MAVQHLCKESTDFISSQKVTVFVINTGTAGAAASPQRPTAIILTASFDFLFYYYMLGVVAIKVSEKYSVHVTQSSKNTRTAGAAASPQRPTAIILTASFDFRFYYYMLGVVAIKVSEKYSVHVTQSSKSSCIQKKAKLDTNLKIVPKLK